MAQSLVDLKTVTAPPAARILFANMVQAPQEVLLNSTLLFLSETTMYSVIAGGVG